MTRLPWIDNMKAVVMIGVYVVHVQFYYDVALPGFEVLAVPIRVTVFFFAAGYLFCRSRHGAATRLRSIACRLVWPTLLFSTLLFLPKQLYHTMADAHYSAPASDSFVYNVLGGMTFWFTAAMSVAEVLLLALLIVCRRRLWVVFAVSLALAVPAAQHPEWGNFPWLWRTALVALPMMAAGGIASSGAGVAARVKDWLLARPALCRYGLAPLFATVYAAACYAVYRGDTVLAVSRSGQANALGLVWTLSALLLLMTLFYRTTRWRWAAYVARHSLTFYLLCGLVPAAVSVAATRLGYACGLQPSVPICWAVIAVSLATSATLAWLIARYAPWATDLRRLSNSK